MEYFQIDPDIVAIVRALAHSKSLREAASNLNADPSSIVRKVRIAADTHGLLQKIKGRWVPTERGQKMTEWLDESIASQLTKLNQKQQRRVSTTMWLAEQIFIPNLSKLHEQAQNAYSWSLRTSSTNIEADILNGQSDFAIVCNAPFDPAIAHRRITAEKWIVIAPSHWSKVNSLDSLKMKPFIGHRSINPDTLFEFERDFASPSHYTDTLIGVRSLVECGYGWSCVPEILVRTALKRKTILKVKIPVSLEGEICLWWLRSRRDLSRQAPLVASWVATSCLR